MQLSQKYGSHWLKITAIGQCGISQGFCISNIIQCEPIPPTKDGPTNDVLSTKNGPQKDGPCERKSDSKKNKEEWTFLIIGQNLKFLSIKKKPKKCVPPPDLISTLLLQKGKQNLSLSTATRFNSRKQNRVYF
jgi:hypothetical protein